MMTTIHIPNDSSVSTHAAIDASFPGDELVFDAGRYIFHKTLVLLTDRRYRIENQMLVRSDPFDGDVLIICPDPVKLHQDGNHFNGNIME